MLFLFLFSLCVIINLLPNTYDNLKDLFKSKSFVLSVVIKIKVCYYSFIDIYNIYLLDFLISLLVFCFFIFNFSYFIFLFFEFCFFIFYFFFCLVLRCKVFLLITCVSEKYLLFIVKCDILFLWFIHSFLLTFYDLLSRSFLLNLYPNTNFTLFFKLPKILLHDIFNMQQ